MKAFFGMTAAALLVVTMLFVSLPGNALAEKVTAAEMVNVKKAADEAAQAAKAQAEKAKTVGEKRLAKQLLKQAEINAEVAGELLEEVKAGEDVSRQDVAFCAAIAKAVHEAAGALAAGDMAKAEDVLDRIARMSSNLPTAANARAEMQGADGAVRNQSVTAEDVKKMPTAANVRAEMQKADGTGKKVRAGECNYPSSDVSFTLKCNEEKTAVVRTTIKLECFENQAGKTVWKEVTVWPWFSGVTDTFPCKTGEICEDGKCKCPPKAKMQQAMAGAQKACGCTTCNECQNCAGETCVPIKDVSPHNPKCLTE